MKKLVSVLLICVASSIASFAQIAITNSLSAAQLVNNYLVGNGVSVSNITSSGNAQQISFFAAGTSNIGLTNGVFISSGNTATVVPPGNPSTAYNGPGDGTLLAIAQSVTSNPAAANITITRDAAAIEFDFVPSGDTVQFRFVFASEEYLTFVNTQYNDVFGFLLTGPNPAGGNYFNQNMAKVPGTNVPITISTIHPGLNGQYYVGNPVGHSFNGFTVPIYIKFAVVCGSTYHFKFAVADCVDGILDTGVFLESGSFSSTSVDVNVAPDVSGDTLVYEGCSSASISFIRPTSQANTTLSVNYTLSGTANMGTDFNTIPNPVVFPIGVDTVSFSITPIADGIPDNNEYVTITAYTISACGDTIISTGTLYLSDSVPINIQESDLTVQCVNDSVLVTVNAVGAFGPYTYSWQGGQVGDTAYFPTVQNAMTGQTNYLVTATNSCGYSETDTLTITLNQTLAVDTMGADNSNYCANTGVAWGMAQGATGQPFYNWTGPNPSSTYTIDASVLQNIPSGWYTFTVSDNVCLVVDSFFVDTDPGPVADFTTSLSTGCAPLSVNFINESSNATIFTWNFGNGNVVTVNDMNPLNQIFTDTSIITLIASDGVCNDTITGLVLIENCGCTDPMATNYNPLATASDGSCVYPTPIIEGPNVITPDGDNVNDVFELDIINAEKVELVITNRWGNVMFKGSGLNPTWDGKVNGNVVSDGVYFYKYTAYSIQGDEVVGHGFFHVVNK